MCAPWFRRHHDARYYLLDLNAGRGPYNEGDRSFPGTVATALDARAAILPATPTTLQAFETRLGNVQALRHWLQQQPYDRALRTYIFPCDHSVASEWCQSQIPAPFWLPRGAIIHDPNGCPSWCVLEELLALPQTKHLDLFLYINAQAIDRVQKWLVKNPTGALAKNADTMRKKGFHHPLKTWISKLQRYKSCWYIQAPHGKWKHAWVFGLNYQPKGQWPSAGIYSLHSPEGRRLLSNT